MTGMHPIAGHPALVWFEGQRAREAAAHMERAAQMLRSLAGDGRMVSEGTEALDERFSEMATVLTKASVRYRGTAEALVEYAPRLEAAQRQADDAIRRAGCTDVWSARGRVLLQEGELAAGSLFMSDEERAVAQAELARARADLADQEAVEAAAESSYRDAVADWEAAAAAAVLRIEAALERSGLDDGFWDDFRGFKDTYLLPMLEDLQKVLEVVDIALSVAAIICMVVPGAQAAVPFLLAAGLAVTALKWQTTMLQFALGGKSWGELASAAILTVIDVVFKATALRGALKTSAKAASSVPLGPSALRPQPSRSPVGTVVEEGSKEVAMKASQYGYQKVPTPETSIERRFIIDPVDDFLEPRIGPPWSTDRLATRDVSLRPVGEPDPDAIMAKVFGDRSMPRPNVSCSTFELRPSWAADQVQPAGGAAPVAAAPGGAR